MECGPRALEAVNSCSLKPDQKFIIISVSSVRDTAIGTSEMFFHLEGLEFKSHLEVGTGPFSLFEEFLYCVHCQLFGGFKFWILGSDRSTGVESIRDEIEF